jgi:hypothetical protein
LQRFAGVAAAVFPDDPERGVYNHALLERDLPASERAAAISAMEAAYEAAGVTRFAAWVHESDAAMRSELERRGYTIDEITRAMGWRSTISVRPGPISNSELRIGRSTCASPACPPGFLAEWIRAYFMSWWQASEASTSRPRSRLTLTEIVGSTTSGRSSQLAAADWLQR